MREKRVCVSRSYAVHVDTVDFRARRRAIPPAAKEIDRVTASRKTPEYLMKVKLCPACLRILSILPIEDENFH